MSTALTMPPPGQSGNAAASPAPPAASAGMGASEGALQGAAQGMAPAMPGFNGGPPVGPGRLSGLEKAAIIVRFLVSEGVRIPLESLPEKMQAELIRQMTRLRHVDKATLGAVLEEFLHSFDRAGLRFPDRIEDALEMLGEMISPKISESLRAQAGLNPIADPWKAISECENEELAALLSRESIEVGAVVLAKLKVTKAAEILGMLPGERARRLAYAVSLTADIAPDIVERIGESLASQLGHAPEKAFSAPPDERVGAILNFSPAATRDEMLEALEETDPEFASLVRKSIFTFAHIPERIQPNDVAKITRQVAQEDLVMALAAATSEKDAKAASFILENMSKRMAEGLREEMQELGSVKQKDGERAMTAVVIAVRELVDAGEITLIEQEEEEEG